MAGRAKTTTVETKPSVSAMKLPVWYNFIAYLLLLIGLFFGARTLANMALYSKYPTIPSTSISSFVGGTQNISEESCSYSSLSASGSPDQTCLKLVSDARDASRVSDITNSTFFIFLGAGLLYLKKRIAA
jgi:hypothetical protein